MSYSVDNDNNYCAISNISRKKNLGIQNNYFSFNVCFIFVCWKYCKVPLHLQLLVKWEVVSPNSRYREFYHEIGNIKKFPGGGGGGCNVFLTFYAISNIYRKKIWEYKIIISHLMFSSCFFFVCWKYCKVPLHLQLLVKWEVVSPNSRYREFYHEIGNIAKFPFTYWLNGRWFLQIVDIHVGNFDMKLTGRWFPQIVDRDSGNLYTIYI